MAEGRKLFNAGPGDDAAAVERINRMIAAVQHGRALGFECGEQAHALMREIRMAMRRGLLAGGEMMEKCGDPFLDEDEIGGNERK